MKISTRAQLELNNYLASNKAMIPGIAWVCDEDYTDYIDDGYWEFGFYQKEKISSDVMKQFLIDIGGISFAVEIPDQLKPKLSEILLDYVDSKFVISHEPFID